MTFWDPTWSNVVFIFPPLVEICPKEETLTLTGLLTHRISVFLLILVKLPSLLTFHTLYIFIHFITVPPPPRHVIEQPSSVQIFIIKMTKNIFFCITCTVQCKSYYWNKQGAKTFSHYCISHMLENVSPEIQIMCL